MIAPARDLHAEAELRLGRPLTGGEKYIDIAGIDRTLEDAKAELVALIEEQKRSAIRGWLEQNPGWWDRLRVTGRIADLLVQLYDAGAEFARAEMRAMGVEPRRQFSSAESRRPNLGPVEQQLAANLSWMGVRLDSEAAHAVWSHPEASHAALLDVIDKAVPGARDAASRVLTPALYGGLGEVYEQNEDLFREGWTYSAVMDAATCDVCETFDGEEYESWEAIQAVLPGGGPNPYCLGGMRCRCRAVPNPMSDEQLADVNGPELAESAEAGISAGGSAFTNAVTKRVTADGFAAIDKVHGIPAGLRKIKLRGIKLASGTRGHLKYETINGLTRAKEIAISSSASSAGNRLTVVHELGHYLDRELLGEKGSMATTAGWAELDEWRAAVEASDLVAVIQADFESGGRIYGRKHAAYLLRERELFARSYAQWIALRASDEKMLRDVAERQMYGHDPDFPAVAVYAPDHWGERDFEPIAAALDKLFAAQRLLHEPPLSVGQ